MYNSYIHTFYFLFNSMTNRLKSSPNNSNKKWGLINIEWDTNILKNRLFENFLNTNRNNNWISKKNWIAEEIANIYLKNSKAEIEKKVDQIKDKVNKLVQENKLNN